MEKTNPAEKASNNSEGEVGDSSGEETIEVNKRRDITKQLPLAHAQG